MKGKKVSKNDFSAMLEKYNRRPKGKPAAGISNAFKKAGRQMGYSNKPRVKPSKKK